MNYHLKANLNKSDEKVIIRFTSGETREYDSLKALQQSEDFAEVFQAVESGGRDRLMKRCGERCFLRRLMGFPPSPVRGGGVDAC